MLCFIGLGSNKGDRLGHLRAAVARMAAHGLTPVRVSGVFETSPVGCPEPQQDYLNAVVSIETHLDPAALVAAALEIERALGRVRTGHNAPRSVDLDVLLMGGTVSADAAATVPHPRMHERLFVLAPLRDIAADVVHPVRGMRIEELYAACVRARRETVKLFAPGIALREQEYHAA